MLVLDTPGSGPGFSGLGGFVARRTAVASAAYPAPVSLYKTAEFEVEAPIHIHNMAIEYKTLES